MKSVSSKIVLTVFLIALFFYLALLTGMGVRDSSSKVEFSILMLRQAIGIFIATVAALMILLRALNNATIANVLILLVAMFGGLTLLSADWPTIIPLGLIIVGYVVIEVIRVFKPVDDSSDSLKPGDE